jgi:hypothetical protein
MESQRRGDATEALVLAELKQRGTPVSLPFGDNERYDAIIESPSGELFRTQIKTGWMEDGSVRFHAKTQHTNSTGNVYKEYGENIDFFLVHSPHTEKVYLIGEDEFDASISLRVKETERLSQRTNWAAEYEFEKRWPLESPLAESEES